MFHADRAITGFQRRRISVLDRMIAADLLKTSAAILLVLVVIIVSQKFIKILAQAIEGNVANGTVLALLGLKTVIVTSSFLPAAVFMSVLMVLGRMYQEQEIAAIASAGGGYLTLYRGVFLYLLPVASCAAALALFAAPWAEAESQQMMHQDRQNADVRGISAGGFREYSNGELIFYTESIDAEGLMHRIFIQTRRGDKTGIVIAESGRLQQMDGGLYLVVRNGIRWMGIAGQKDFTQEKYEEYAVLIENKASTLIYSNQAATTGALWSSASLQNTAELQNRIAVPLGCLLLAVLATPLAKVSPRHGVFGSLLIAFAIYFTYGNLQRLNYNWVSNGAIPVWIGYLWLHALLLLIALMLLMRNSGWQWIWQRLRGLG